VFSSNTGSENDLKNLLVCSAYNFTSRTSTYNYIIIIIIVIMVIIIEFLTSQPQMGNIHLSWDM